MKNTLAILVFTAVLFTACEKNVDEDLNPEDMCITEDMSYANDIVPILRNNCYGCHNSDARQGGVVLDSYTTLKAVVDKNRLLGAIRRQEGFSPMPRNAPKLPDCDINQIAAWKADGAPNN